jgi:hypothetical protein
MLRILHCLDQCCPTFLCTRAQFTDAYGGAGDTTLYYYYYYYYHHHHHLIRTTPTTTTTNNNVKIFNSTQKFKNAFVLKFELILIIGSNNVLTAGAALDRAGLDNRHIDGCKAVIPTHQPHFTPQKHFFLMFPVLISVRG